VVAASSAARHGLFLPRKGCAARRERSSRRHSPCTARSPISLSRDALPWRALRLRQANHPANTRGAAWFWGKDSCASHGGGGLQCGRDEL